MRHLTKPTTTTRGFTLVELLVSIVIAAAVTVGITSLLNSDFQANATVQRYQRLRRQVNRARRFIDMEATMASRLQLNGNNSFDLFGVAGATPYSIRYEVVAAASANQSGAIFRGPFVLRRTGPAYDQNGNLLAAQANQSSVVLDGLASANGLTVQSQAGSSRGARLTFNLAEAGSTFNPEFAVGVATSSRYGLLQSPTSEFTKNCTGTPNGCRQILNAQGAIEIQEWDTRLTSGTTTITPVGSPQQVVVYFNELKPAAQNAIRGTSGDNASRCIRSSCFVAVGSGGGYTINNPVHQLVFLDEVIAVPPS
jgi:prepilin-type N-terminal cleavage/methylation domain-containing protein